MNNKSLYFWLIDSSVIAKKSRWKYIRYILRSLLDWRVNSSWVSYLNSSPEIKVWKDNYGALLYLKVQYPYLSGCFNTNKVLLCLKQHYDWFFANIHSSYHLDQEVKIWIHEIKNESTSDLLEMYLKFKADFVHEGEVSLLLKLNHEIQYSVSFSSILENERKIFFVGGLQGGKPDITSPEIIKKLTKQLFGLRPKQLMIHALSSLADFYQIDDIIGVSNQNHPFSYSRRKSKRARIKTKMDDFWMDFDAEIDAHSNYVFKPLNNQINLDEIASKKRSQYRKRQLILDDLVRQSQVKLECLKYDKKVEIT